MAGGRFSPLKAPVKFVHSNLEQEIIQITEDRLRLILKDHLALAEDRKTWIGPLGILLAIITAFVTADFRDFLFKAPVWQAVFLITGFLSLAWLIYSIYRANNAPSIDDIIKRIKSGDA